MVLRREVVRILALNAICDDYEEIGQIGRDVAQNGRDCGMKIERAEILEALSELVDSGLAKAYRLYADKRPPEELDGMPSAELLVEHGAYFLITPQGMKLQSADYGWWPFDRDNVLRKDWLPPES